MFPFANLRCLLVVAVVAAAIAGCPRTITHDVDAGPCGVTDCALDDETGITTCDQGASQNRTTQVACAELPPPPEPQHGTGCVAHSECPDGTFCVIVDDAVFQDDVQETECQAPCSTDDDCGEGRACMCALYSERPFNTCVPARCRTDDECGGTHRCGIAQQYCTRHVELACRTDDLCANCGSCFPDAEGSWSSVDGDCD